MGALGGLIDPALFTVAQIAQADGPRKGTRMASAPHEAAAGLYGSPIYWLETAPHEPAPPLEGAQRADVVIVGGGFTGLWTAYELKRAEPALDVVIVEAMDVGYGASGRNGGFAMTLLDMSLAHLVRNQGENAAKVAHEAVAQSVDAIGQACAAEGIDCEYVKGGLMVVATNAGQERRIDQDLEAAERLGLGGFVALTGDQCRERVASPTYLRGYWEEACAVLHPAKLARGLARVLLGKGVRLHERTAVRAVERDGDDVVVRCAGGEVRAQQAVVATNAWARELPAFRRKVVPLYTYVLMTEPLTDAQWGEVGWANREGVEDKRNFVHYYRRTADGRILWGGGDGHIYRGLRIRPELDRSELVRAQLEETFRETFPQLADVKIAYHWGGPVGITAPFVPYFGSIEGGRVHYGHGYNGHGVAPTHTGGCILADRVIGRDRGYGNLPFVDGREPAFPPAALTVLGAAMSRWGLRRQDRAMAAGRDAGEMDPLLLRILRKLG
jgi:glycine/D-amino acid oxidase-like deaminating enzyme